MAMRRRPMRCPPDRRPRRRRKPRTRSPNSPSAIPCSTSPTPTWPFPATCWWRAITTASTPITWAQDGVPQLVGSVVCPGGQGDVSIVGDLLIMSVEQTRGRVDCGRQGVSEKVSPERFRGLRIFDISDITHPVQVGQVQTCRGSHTHSVVATTDTSLIVYNSGTSSVRDEDELAGCVGDVPGDTNTALFRIDVIEIPLANPAGAHIVSSPAVFADPETGRDRRPVARRRPWRRHAGHQPHRPVPRHHRVPVEEDRGRRLFGQRDHLRHLRSAQSQAHRRGGRRRLSPTGTRPRSTMMAPRCCSPTNGAAAGGRAARPRTRAIGVPMRSTTSSMASWSAAAPTSCPRRRARPRTASRIMARSSRCRGAISMSRRGTRAGCR